MAETKPGREQRPAHQAIGRNTNDLLPYVSQGLVKGDIMAKTNSQANAELMSRWVRLTPLYDLNAFTMNDEDRIKCLKELSKSITETKPGDLGLANQEPLTLTEDILTMVFLFWFLGSMLWIPGALILFVLFVRSWWAWGGLITAWLVLTTHPVERIDDFVHSRLNRLLFKYFSLKMAWEVPLDSKGRYLMIAPPHGVLPFGNLLTVHGMKNVAGFEFRGITTDMALKVPFFRHYLGWVGTVSANAKVTKHWLDQGWSIGISSGGVAEIFETNNKDEVILMKNRKGFVKLALKTGTPIVPAYIFGNTKLMSAWYDKHGILQAISRKLKAGFLPIWGRYGLPIFHRYPILGVTGIPIVVPKVDEPNQEQIDHYHALFVQGLQEVFEKYKGYYGWSERKLIIK